MGLSGPGFSVEPEVLTEASTRMAAIVADQDAHELTTLDGAPDTYGHPGLAAAFGTYCDRWSVGVDALCDRARAMGDALGKAAGTCRLDDEDARSLFDRQMDPGLATVTEPRPDPRNSGS